MDLHAASTPKLQKDFLFHMLIRAHFNAQQAGLTDSGLTNLGSPRILFVLADLEEENRPTPSQRELASILHLSPATIATALKSLERSGYVSRQTDQKDSRKNLISLTDYGRQAIFTCRRVFDAVDDHMFYGFSQQEQQQLHNFHQRMLNNLYQIGGDKDSANCPPPPPERR